MRTKFVTVKKLMLLVVIFTLTLTTPGAFTNYLAAADLPPRIFGGNRYQTAVEISKAGGGSAAVVILSRSDDYADALAAAPLAYKLNAPILLTAPGALDHDTRDEIKRLGASRVLVLGGAQAVSPEVAGTLTALGLTVERIAGKDRFETAAVIAVQAAASAGVPGVAGSTALIVYGFNFPDALAAAAYAAINGHPILLTGTDSLPAETSTALDQLDIQHTIVIGGTGVISEAVMDKLPDPTRLSGEDRYATAVKLAEYFKPSGDHCFIATGLNFADGVTGAVLAAKHNSGILLVDHRNTPDELRDYFQRAGVTNFTIFGGTAAVSGAVEGQLRYGLPNIPTGFRATLVGRERVFLQWDAAAGATAYHIYVRTQADYVKLATVSQTNYNHTGLEPSTTYRYKVSAVNAAGEGVLSEEIAVVVKPTRGLVTFVLDDGTYNQYKELYPLFQSKGIPAVWSIPTGLISNPSLAPFPLVPATWAQIDEVAKQSNPRWEINSHSHTHPRLAYMSPAALQFELAESKRLLDQYGVYSLTYPYYSVNSTVVHAAANYYRAAYAGGVKAGEHYPVNMFGAGNLNNINYADYVTANPHALKRVTLFISDATESRWKALIDTAYAKDGWLVFCVHNVNSSTKKELGNIIDYCLKLGIPIGVTQDGLDRYKR